jgi:solute carrier family 35 protein F3/4
MACSTVKDTEQYVVNDSDEEIMERKPEPAAEETKEGDNLGKPLTLELNTFKKFFFGLFIVVFIAVSWVGSTQTAKSTYNPTFSAPFFMVWFNTSWMVICYPLLMPVYLIKVWLRDRAKFTSASYRFGVLQGIACTLREMWRESCLVFSSKGVTLLSLLTSTVFFTVVWEATNYSYLRALSKISSTDVTALFSSTPAFVYILSLFILKEPLLILRMISVTLAVGGVVLFMYSEGFSPGSLEGMILSIVAAIGAAIYKVCLKRRVGDAGIFQMGLFLTFLGLFNLLAFWPIVVILHFTHVEPLSHVPWSYVCGSAGLGLLFNFFINFGIAFTFPIFISFGTILGIPINAILDSLVRKVPFEGWKLTATDLIVGGFMLMLIPISDSRRIHRKIGALLKYIGGKCICRRCCKEVS